MGEIKMKVLSVQEPWGSLIKEQVKYVETRSWKTNYRGTLYIHTSLKPVNQKDSVIPSLLSLLPPNDLVYGAIVAKCQLVDCIQMDETYVTNMKDNKIEYLCGGYAVGRYAWVLQEIEKLEVPIPVKGHLGIWEYKESL